MNLRFSTKEMLISEYAKFAYGSDSSENLASARAKAKYVPHIYRGGWFIEDFGHSKERIDKGFISLENAGSPEIAVES